MIYNCADRTGDSKTACEAILNLPAQNQANEQNALDLTQQRVSQIQSLQDSISTTQDPKAIAELQARIAAENVQVNNDANRIALMQAMAASQQQAADQAMHERVLKMIAKDTPRTIDSFVYKLPNN
jgi:type IV secretion system protein VirB5